MTSLHIPKVFISKIGENGKSWICSILLFRLVFDSYHRYNACILISILAFIAIPIFISVLGVICIVLPFLFLLPIFIPICIRVLLFLFLFLFSLVLLLLFLFLGERVLDRFSQGVAGLVLSGNICVQVTARILNNCIFLLLRYMKILVKTEWVTNE